MGHVDGGSHQKQATQTGLRGKRGDGLPVILVTDRSHLEKVQEPRDGVGQGKLPDVACLREEGCTSGRAGGVRGGGQEAPQGTA